MPMRIISLSQANAEKIATWHYPSQYAFYNTDADAEDYAEILSSKQRGNRFYQVTDDHDSNLLIGYFAIEATADADVLEVGLGMTPVLTGHGYGLSFVQTLVAFIVSHYQPRELQLHVAEFSQRAQITYQRADFEISKCYSQTDTDGKVYPFIIMSRNFT
ncbi:acetyltransferase, GNAT family [Lactiplantibacillus paraplantarum]|nr:GNAT family protein [Lactiplantibacillus paraplantarum]ERL45559.1 acetyltransferase, GNAT family [Lactiplantibacillus paraplantarum]KRL50199.1 hypothetical protein FD48_GL002761 [Lactiplantibacillus paraplantarum DSM 10667]MCU4682940.1 GNAT family N-acetyltransferase [Lactiplantibacillus paraplantarum]GEO61170.1 N-acetyltransferase [Lactiplantibacillus paraplantarum]